MALGTLADLAAARQKLDSQARAGTKDAATMIQWLRLVRELHVQDSEGVCEFGTYVLAKAKGQLGLEEYWQLQEDVLLAAAYCGVFDVAEHCLHAVTAQFPNSLRAKCLRGMLLEAQGDAVAAAEVYDQVLEQSPSNTTAQRRKIAMHITRGDIAAAIQAATDYLDVFQTDRVVWEQLHRLYLQANMREQAVFCLEECLLQAPGDAATALKLANLLLQQGGAQVAAARGYFARVIELTRGENAQALEGLLACEDAIAAGKSAKGKGKSKGGEEPSGPTELGKLAKEQLAQLRKKHPGYGAASNSNAIENGSSDLVSTS